MQWTMARPHQKLVPSSFFTSSPVSFGAAAFTGFAVDRWACVCLSVSSSSASPSTSCLHSREGARVLWNYINRILGQPSLIRESSLARFPWSGLVSRVRRGMPASSPGGRMEPSSGRQPTFGGIVLHPSLQTRIERLARATSNTKAHEAPFRNMLFYGPPGTGKTMVAREMARKSVGRCS